MINENKRRSSGKLHVLVLWFIRILLVLFALYAYSADRRLVLFVSVFGFIVSFLPGVLHNIFGIHVPAGVEAIVVLFSYGVLVFLKVRFVDLFLIDVVISFFAAIVLGFVSLSVFWALEDEGIIEP